MGKGISVFPQQAENLGTNGAETKQRDAYSFAFAFTSADLGL